MEKNIDDMDEVACKIAMVIGVIISLIITFILFLLSVKLFKWVFA